MKSSHPEALQAFARRLALLLMLRGAVQMTTLWFFVWGVVVLVLRICRIAPVEWLALGMFGFAPLALLMALRERQRQPAFTRLRAGYDRMNACGGMVMAAETADMGEWLSRLPEAVIPRFRWHSSRPLLLLFLSAGFLATTLLLPDWVTRPGLAHSLQIGQMVGQLQLEVKTLAQEKILEEKKATDLQQQLERLQKDASAYDPNKTWEALDHIKQANSDAAKAAAEEALAKTESLTQAETLARAMESAADAGMSEATAAAAARDLASMLNSAQLEAGILSGKIPPELLSHLDGLNKEQLNELLKALTQKKGALGLTITNLAQLKLIDPALLAKCTGAGRCFNTNALAAYLCSCTNGCNAAAMCQRLGRGGPGGGGPEAPMVWDNDTSEKDLKFQEHALPPATSLSDAQMVGVSQAAPELSGGEVVAAHGALDQAAGGGGSAHAQVILPEHRQAVQKFFKREN